MIKILTAEQIRKADAYTIQHEPVSSVHLMERAANAFVTQFLLDFPNKQVPTYIFCGNGNNGGDGLAIARLLIRKGYTVEVLILPAKQYSKDCLHNLTRLQKQYKKHLQNIQTADIIQQLQRNAIVIDAIFGTGLNKPILQGTLSYQVIEKINQKNFSQVVAVDIPSGLFADNTLQDIAIKAYKTYTFQFPKLSFLLPKSGAYVGDFKVLNIGLHADFIEKIATDKFLMETEDVSTHLIHRTKFSHKGIYGHVLLGAGSYGKMGAAVLSGKAVLRSGAGLVTAHVPACGYDIFQTAFPEAMCSIDKQKEFIATFPAEDTYDAVAIGPGIGTHAATIRALATFLKKQKRPVVLDADALNCMALQKKILQSIPAYSILTPHPKEFERIAGKWSTDTERLQLQQNFSRKHKVIVILKGAHSSISHVDGTIYFNITGNAGMATAGSGDVLTGILAGLLAQGYAPLDAARIGVYLHGAAGDMALKEQSMESMIASDIIEHLGNAFKAVQQHVE